MNPQALEGQIEGGTAQGLGLALLEEIQVRDGKVLNASFTDYLLPTILDMPPVRIEMLEHADPEAPYGLKGVGEPPNISTPPAVAAALRDATGRELRARPGPARAPRGPRPGPVQIQPWIHQPDRGGDRSDAGLQPCTRQRRADRRTVAGGPRAAASTDRGGPRRRERVGPRARVRARHRRCSPAVAPEVLEAACKAVEASLDAGRPHRPGEGRGRRETPEASARRSATTPGRRGSVADPQRGERSSSMAAIAAAAPSGAQTPPCRRGPAARQARGLRRPARARVLRGRGDRPDPARERDRPARARTSST